MKQTNFYLIISFFLILEFSILLISKYDTNDVYLTVLGLLFVFVTPIVAVIVIDKRYNKAKVGVLENEPQEKVFYIKSE